MSSKPIFYLTLFAIILSGCKKIKQQANSITLDPPVVSGNKVTLHWSPLLSGSLTRYQIVKITDSTSPQTTETFYVEKGTTEYTDTLSLSPYAQYAVYAQSNAGGAIASNKQMVTRTDIDFIHITPLGVVVNKDAGKAYIYSSVGDIVLCDLSTKKPIRQIAAAATTGHCCLGTYNGRQELYVPRTDGWLFIYDAATLDQVDQINIGIAAYGVAFSNGRLFVNQDQYGQFLVINRATKAIYVQNHIDGNMRLVPMPGANASVIGVSMYSTITRLTYSLADNFVYRYASALPTTTNVFDLVDVFPDAKRVMASSEGIITDTALQYLATLPHGDMRYTSFDFNPAANLIYAACTTQVVHTYDMNSYQFIAPQSTRGYPFKVICNNGALLSVSTCRPMFINYDQPTQEPMYTFLEQL